MTGKQEFLVIGSGPSGVAAAAALIRAGHRPLVIDGGVEPKFRVISAQDRSRQVGPSSGQAIELSKRSHSGQKTWFGSASPYAQSEALRINYEPTIVARVSFGVGGFSRVWGGTFSFAQSINDWPEDCVPSREDFEHVRQLVPHAKTTWSVDSCGQKPGARGSMVSKMAMDRFRDRSHRHGWSVEASSVAIDVDPHGSSACKPCGQCLTGCPRDAIWYSGSQIARWKDADLIDYRPGWTATKVLEVSGAVDVTIKRSTETSKLSAERVLVAAGALGTAALLVRSGYVDELVLADSATAFSGALSLLRPRAQEPSHDLSQWWVRSPDGLFGAQLYAPNTAHTRRLAEHLHLGSALSVPLRQLAKRLHPIVAYLDPSLSDHLTLRLKAGELEVSGKTTRESLGKFRKYFREFGESLRQAGYPIPPFATDYSPPGTGYHFGSSIPHGSASDHLGRPFGLTRIHVVDSSVLPNFGVGSITPTTMANATRIARGIGA